MGLIPDEELKPNIAMNFAPMIDFLFLMLALFATLALTRSALYDSSIDLAKLKANETDNMVLTEKDLHRIHLSIDQKGQYHWVTEFNEHLMQTTDQMQQELAKQHHLGLIPKDKRQTMVLLHIDRKAPWNAVAQLVFAIKEIGFDVHPIHESDKES